jgi:hypothetical protein
MAAFKQMHSIVRGTLAEILALTGDYVGQKAYANNYGVSARGAKLFWNGAAWLWDTNWQPLSLLRAAVTIPADTTEDIALTYTLPKLGANDMLRVQHFWTVTNNANAKTVRVNIGDTGTMAAGFACDIASNQVANFVTEMRNRAASPYAQDWFSNNKAPFGAVSGSLQTTTKDPSTAGRLLTITGQKATSGDSMVLNWADLWICGGGTA